MFGEWFSTFWRGLWIGMGQPLTASIIPTQTFQDWAYGGRLIKVAEGTPAPYGATRIAGEETFVFPQAEQLVSGGIIGLGVVIAALYYARRWL